MSRYILRARSPGCPGGGAGKEGELATTSLEFEYLHRKRRCEMLIGGDDINNDTLPLARSFTCFSKLVYICARFRFALIGGNLTAQWKESHRKIWRRNSNSRDVLPFPAPPPKRPGELARRLVFDELLVASFTF